uniref:(northern house mosquito) hypothetical protein n=1 Tax=Culex pipiens TaxID=7175 RepID=A0A8D8HBN2_CULPI
MVPLGKLKADGLNRFFNAISLPHPLLNKSGHDLHHIGSSNDPSVQFPLHSHVLLVVRVQPRDAVDLLHQIGGDRLRFLAVDFAIVLKGLKLAPGKVQNSHGYEMKRSHHVQVVRDRRQRLRRRRFLKIAFGADATNGINHPLNWLFEPMHLALSTRSRE